DREGPGFVLNSGLDGDAVSGEVAAVACLRTVGEEIRTRGIGEPDGVVGEGRSELTSDLGGGLSVLDGVDADLDHVRISGAYGSLGRASGFVEFGLAPGAVFAVTGASLLFQGVDQLIRQWERFGQVAGARRCSGSGAVEDLERSRGSGGESVAGKCASCEVVVVYQLREP